jgi:hypothetical protein
MKVTQHGKITPENKTIRYYKYDWTKRIEYEKMLKNLNSLHMKFDDPYNVSEEPNPYNNIKIKITTLSAIFFLLIIIEDIN